MLEENKAKGSAENKEEGAVKKKKLAVVFHSQNSVNHKNHPLGGKFSDKAKKTREQEKKDEEKKSPNGRPLPPGTARVTPLKALNAIQKKKAEEERKLEEEKRLQEEREAEERARREAEEAAKAAQAVKEEKAETKAPSAPARSNRISGISARPVQRESRASDGERGERRSASFAKTDRRPSFSKDGDKKFEGGRGKAPFAKKPAAQGFAPDIVEKQSRVKHDSVKPQKKVYGNKSFENEKASLSEKHRAERKQNKYGATQSYDRDEQVKVKRPLSPLRFRK